jgi:hypothetical protein
MSRREHLSFERELEEANSAALPEIVTPAYDASAVPSGNLGDEDDEYDEEAENEHYSRSRSRSRSFNEHDSNVPIDLLMNVDPSKIPVVPVSGGGGGGEFPPAAPPITERSGPLQQREVLALKKVNSEFRYAITFVDLYIIVS